MALKANETFNIASLPHYKHPMGYKWVFTMKVNPNDTVARLKAQLVAKEYAQIYGVHYSETFSPIAKHKSMRLFISLATSFG